MAVLTIAQVLEIQRCYGEEGNESLNAVAKLTGMARQTIRQYVFKGDPIRGIPPYVRKIRKSPVQAMPFGPLPTDAKALADSIGQAVADPPEPGVETEPAPVSNGVVVRAAVSPSEEARQEIEKQRDALIRTARLTRQVFHAKVGIFSITAELRVKGKSLTKEQLRAYRFAKSLPIDTRDFGYVAELEHRLLLAKKAGGTKEELEELEGDEKTVEELADGIRELMQAGFGEKDRKR